MIESTHPGWTARAYLVVEGFECDGEEITRRLGVVPSRLWRKGDPRRNGRGVYDYAGWQLDSTAPTNGDVEAHVRSILERIPKNAAALEGVGGDWSVSVRCVVMSDLRGDTPPLSFDSDIVKWLAGLGADLDIDLYVDPGGA